MDNSLIYHPHYRWRAKWYLARPAGPCYLYTNNRPLIHCTIINKTIGFNTSTTAFNFNYDGYKLDEIFSIAEELIHSKISSHITDRMYNEKGE